MEEREESFGFEMSEFGGGGGGLPRAVDVAVATGEDCGASGGAASRKNRF
jgi:hypothetical protein